MPLASVVTLNEVVDDRGSLVAAQHPGVLPFTVARVFIVGESKAGQKRGGHAHRECQQLLIAVSGSIEVFLEDSAGSRSVTLSKTCEGLYLPPLVWAEQTYLAPESTLLVLASHLYDVDDYIDDADESRRLRFECETGKN